MIEVVWMKRDPEGEWVRIEDPDEIEAAKKSRADLEEVFRTKLERVERMTYRPTPLFQSGPPAYSWGRFLIAFLIGAALPIAFLAFKAIREA